MKKKIQDLGAVSVTRTSGLTYRWIDGWTGGLIDGLTAGLMETITMHPTLLQKVWVSQFFSDGLVKTTMGMFSPGNLLDGLPPMAITN